MKFFNIDLHISVIQDIKTIFENLGHSVDSLLISDHYWVFKQARDTTKVINNNNWKNIDDKMCEEFYNAYKTELQQYDGFIVTHTPVFSKLFEKFEKPIITMASTRYEYPYTFDKNKWTSLNKYLKNNKNIILVSNNRYDKKYCELFLQKDVELIESLCSYTNSAYDPLKDESVLYSKKNLSNFIFRQEIKNKNSLGFYKWQDLFNYRSIIHFPYNISTMSIFEQYTANVPLFFPTKNLLLQLFKTDLFPLTELSYKRIAGICDQSTLNIDEDPNKWHEIDIFKKWIDLADFYNFKNVNYYDDLYEINEIPFLSKEELLKISYSMQQENIERKNKIYNSWKTLLEKIKL